jgi:hypothetical protein
MLKEDKPCKFDVDKELKDLMKLKYDENELHIINALIDTNKVQNELPIQNGSVQEYSGTNGENK